MFGLAFLAALVGQAITGHADYDEQQIARGAESVSFTEYVTSSSFAVDVAENWQSEYLQFFLYTFGTVWLVQRGSPESKPLDQIGTESDAEQRIGPYADPDAPRWARIGGWRTALFCSAPGGASPYSPPMISQCRGPTRPAHRAVLRPAPAAPSALRGA